MDCTRMYLYMYMHVAYMYTCMHISNRSSHVCINIMFVCLRHESNVNLRQGYIFFFNAKSLLYFSATLTVARYINNHLVIEA